MDVERLKILNKKKLIIFTILSIIIASSFQVNAGNEKNFEELNKKKIKNQGLIGIKLGFINVSGDGTKTGSYVKVTAIDGFFDNLYGKFVFFYIDYSIISDGINDRVNIEIDTKINNGSWKNGLYQFNDNYSEGQITLENVRLNQGVRVDTFIRAIYINPDPLFVIWDDDMSTFALHKYINIGFLKIINRLKN